MRRLLLIAMVLLMAAPVVDARRRKPRAGTVEDRVYKDATYDFTFRISDNWDYSRGYDEDPFRITLTQSNWETPPYYLNNPDYTKVPRVVVYADTTSIGVFDFLDSLVSESYDSDQKDEILKEFEILQPNQDWEEVIPIGRRVMEIDGERAVLWTGKVQYTMEVALSASAVGGKRVREYYFASILAAKSGKTIVMFHVIGEWVYYDRISADFMEMIQSLDFAGNDKKSKPKESGEEG